MPREERPQPIHLEKVWETEERTWRETACGRPFMGHPWRPLEKREEMYLQLRRTIDPAKVTCGHCRRSA